MQLDKTRIAIRERGMLEILDLALHVFRAEGLAVLLALAAGAVPAALFNHYLLSSSLIAFEYREGPPVEYIWWQWVLTVIEVPVATAFITLYLGEALFVEKPKPRELLRKFARCLPQLLWYQVLIRGLWSLLGWLVPYLTQPYLNEIILLERNPWRGKGGREISTNRRSSMLQSANNGDFFLCWIVSIFLGGLLTLVLWLSFWFLRGMLAGKWEFDLLMYTIALPIAEWLVLGYFAVVRYLHYLDLRIRREGWEVELLLRAERIRLMPLVT